MKQFAIIIFLFASACDPSYLSEENIVLPLKTDVIINNYKETYGFERIDIIYIKNDRTSSYNLMINAVNADSTLINDEDLSLIELATSEIFYSLDSSYRRTIDHVSFYLTEDEGKFFLNSSRSQVFSYKIIEGGLRPSYMR